MTYNVFGGMLSPTLVAHLTVHR